MGTVTTRIAWLVAAAALTAGVAPAQSQDKPAAEAPSSATVPADRQPTRAQLDNLFEVMRVKQQLDSVSAVMPKLMQQSISQQFEATKKEHPEMQSLTPAQRDAEVKIMERYMKQVSALYTPDEMLDDMAELYQKHLSWADVDGMIGFYSSPAGQHSLDMVPTIMKEFMPLVMKKMQDRVQPALDQMTKEMTDLAKPAAHADGAPAAK